MLGASESIGTSLVIIEPEPTVVGGPSTSLELITGEGMASASDQAEVLTEGKL